MRGRRGAGIAILALAALTVTHDAPAGPATLPSGFHDSQVVGGLNLPTGMAFLPDGRVLFVEQVSGQIRLIVNGAIAAVDPVCTVPEVKYFPDSEQGLLGIAVDPQWPARPFVYVHYDHALTPMVHIARFTAAGDLDNLADGSLTIDPASRYLVINDVPDNSTMHNGGTLRFGPDGMLYASIGDDNAKCSAQDLTFLRGKIIRLVVSGLPAGPGGPPARAAISPPDNPFPAHANANARLIWSFGLRNPFRFAIDSSTGALFVCDVGQSAWEEVNWVPAAGMNFGWPIYEGPSPNMTCAGFDGSGSTPPTYSYSAGGGGFAVMSGPVYRAPGCPGTPALFQPEYIGDYFFADYYQGFLRRLKYSAGSWSVAAPVPGQPSSLNWAQGLSGVSDYGVGCDGAIWYCRQSIDFSSPGEIRRIVYHGVTEVPPATPRVRFAAPWPSPARGSVNLAYDLPAAAQVALTLFDARGRRVRRLVPERLEAMGPHQYVWDGREESGRSAPAGIYWARLKVNGGELVQRFPLLP